MNWVSIKRLSWKNLLEFGDGSEHFFHARTLHQTPRWIATLLIWIRLVLASIVYLLPRYIVFPKQELISDLLLLCLSFFLDQIILSLNCLFVFFNWTLLDPQFCYRVLHISVPIDHFFENDSLLYRYVLQVPLLLFSWSDNWNHGPLYVLVGVHLLAFSGHLLSNLLLKSTRWHYRGKRSGTASPPNSWTWENSLVCYCQTCVWLRLCNHLWWT